MFTIGKNQLIARLKKNSIDNGGSYIIPDIVYELIEEQWSEECAKFEQDNPLKLNR